MKTLVAEKFPETHLGRLAKLGCEVSYEPGVKAEELPRIIAPFKILVVRGKPVTGDALRAGEQLALVLRAGAGVNTIDVKTANARGIFVSNCPGKNSVAVAELVFALLLGLDRRIPDNVAALRAGRWNKKEFSKADGLFGKTLGVIGTGQIGREVISRAHSFGLRILAWSRSLTPDQAEDLGAERCAEVEDVFRRADIITLHVALKPETRRLVNAERLALMKPNAILINTARGEVVDQTRPERSAPSRQASRRAGRLRPRAGCAHRRFQRSHAVPAQSIWHPSHRRLDRASSGSDRRRGSAHHRDFHKDRRGPQLRQPRQPHARQRAACGPPL